MTSEPLSEAILKAKEFGRILKKQCPKGWGFVVVLANFNEVGQQSAMTYLSSIEREGCIKMLKELTEKMENNAPEIRDTN